MAVLMILPYIGTECHQSCSSSKDREATGLEAPIVCHIFPSSTPARHNVVLGPLWGDAVPHIAGEEIFLLSTSSSLHCCTCAAWVHVHLH